MAVAERIWNNFLSNSTGSLSTAPSVVSNGFGTFVNFTNVAFGSTPIGKWLQAGRLAESLGVSLATGTDQGLTTGELVNAAAALAVGS